MKDAGKNLPASFFIINKNYISIVDLHNHTMLDLNL